MKQQSAGGGGGVGFGARCDLKLKVKAKLFVLCFAIKKKRIVRVSLLLITLFTMFIYCLFGIRTRKKV